LINYTKNTSVYILYFFPIAVVIGEFAINLSITLSIILFIFLCIAEKKFFYFKDKYFIIFLTFVSFLLIGSIFSQFKLNSFINTIIFLRYPLFALSIFYILNNYPNFIKKFFFSFFFIISILFIDSFYQNLNTYKINIIGFEMLDKNRISSLFGKDYVLGSFLSRSLIIIFLYLNLVINKIKKIYLIILLLLLNYTIFLSGDRAALLVTILYQLFLIVFNKDLRKVIIYFFLTMSILVIIHLNIFKNSYSRYYSTTIDQINNFEETNYDDMYYMSLKIFEDNIIFGSGAKSYRYACKLYNKDKNISYLKDGCSTHPHQTYLQILAETGLIGFIIFSFFWINIIKDTINGIIFKNNKIMICGIFIFLIYMPILPSGNFFGTWNNSLIFLNLGFFLYYRHSYKLQNIKYKL